MLHAEADANTVLGLGEEMDYSQGLPTMGDIGQMTENTVTGSRISSISWLALGIAHDWAKFGRGQKYQPVLAGAEAVAAGASIYFASQIINDPRVETSSKWFTGVLAGFIGVWSALDVYNVLAKGQSVTPLTQKAKKTFKFATGG